MSRRRSNISTGGQTAAETHDVVPAARAAEGREAELDSSADELPARDIAGGSPQTPASDFVPLLEGMRGAPQRQARALKQLQRGYGNSFVGKALQTKLAVGGPQDASEQEAERVAEQAVSPARDAHAAATPRQRVAGSEPSATPREGQESAHPGLERRLESERAGGRPLPEDVRARMESRLGADFGEVRVHADGEATRMNRELEAEAFTAGRDIYFGEGKYEPESKAGEKLLAHELAHVVQQSDAVQPRRVQRQPTGPQEQKAVAQDPVWTVRGLMDDPLWAVDQNALAQIFATLNGLEINHLMHTLAALSADGYMGRLTPFLASAQGVDLPRLGAAFNAVVAKGRKTSPEIFGLTHRAALETLPVDQRLSVLRYLGPIPDEPVGEVVHVGKTTYVILDDEVRYGSKGEDTKTWRTNNPGALTVPPAVAPSKKEKENKAAIEALLKGRAYRDSDNQFGYKFDEAEGGAKLAVFPTPEAGRQALTDKLAGFQNRRARLRDFGASQLGSAAAGAGYAELMVTLLKERRDWPYQNRSITVDTLMSDIELSHLAEVTQKREGWNPHDKGVTVRWSDADKLAELPPPVQFRVMLAQWMRSAKPQP
jgi:Domain of unknown function (DUF4157)